MNKSFLRFVFQRQFASYSHQEGHIVLFDALLLSEVCFHSLSLHGPVGHAFVRHRVFVLLSPFFLILFFFVFFKEIGLVQVVLASKVLHAARHVKYVVVIKFLFF